MRLLPLLSACLLLATATAQSVAAEKADTLTVKTSLGPLVISKAHEGDGPDQRTRQLRAKGVAPKGSRLTAHFYRGKVKLGKTRPKVGRDRRYKTDYTITRTGVYKVRVVALTPAGETVKVTAKLRYTPKAKAPSAPDDTAP